MSFIDTEKALQKALNSIVDLPRIAWPNTKFEPVIGQSFIRPTLLPAASELYTLNEYNKHKGLYQIDIYVPCDKGTKDLYNIADNIRTFFQENRRLLSNNQTVLVMEIDLGRFERQEAWYTNFVEIHYISFN